MVEERNEGRVFARPRKIYRARYSRTEVAAGGVVLLVLAAIAAWVAARGAHPDPDLLRSVSLERRAPETAVRGAIPAGVAPSGWTAASFSQFDPSNLYVKIDGREGYYKTFGFVRLDCATLARTSTSGEKTIDLELYDLGTEANALGAMSGEVPEGATPRLEDGSLSLIHRNTLYFVRGHHYLRALGSAEDAEVLRALTRVEGRFREALAAEPLPWSYGLFLELGIAPNRVAFVPENAFSFGFAKRIYVGTMSDGETELFVGLEANDAEAKASARRFQQGFGEHGRGLGTAGGLTWTEDEWLHRASAAGALGRWVFGVHGAADRRAGVELYQRMEAALKSKAPEEEPSAR